ncbi:LuxR C-terminal-related transcriptional regulator [Kitasatospora sp. NPDC094028]
MTDEPGPAERDLYLTAVRLGGRLRPADLAPEDRPTLAALVARGLVTPTAAGWTAANPRSLGDRVGVELRGRAIRLLRQAEHLPDRLAPLARAYDTVRSPVGRLGTGGWGGGGPDRPGDAERPGVRRRDTVSCAGGVAVRRRIAELLADCREEFLSAQTGPRPLDGLQDALPEDLALLRRGCAVRALYQPVALADRPVLRQIELRVRGGAQARVLPEPYERLLVFDRTTAVIPAGEEHTGAVFLDDPATVRYLVSRFERDWARATPLDRHLGPPHPTTARVGRLLAHGLTQRAIGARLGLSERTVAAHIARLRDRHGAQTLFHLGWRMRGVSDA